ncbi:hypothetical protein [Neisseria musculi]|uniref:Uncharacterized protein n=1 Tax=Neisseria musculi TaxID=1815583 RepID=A0A7H1MB86_9NEIS|nr:hypothetical protein [Neisseria musculi]QNT58901.1 hypothetical protein H7A79_0928 [Neisseria musculi]
MKKASAQYHKDNPTQTPDTGRLKPFQTALPLQLSAAMTARCNNPRANIGRTVAGPLDREFQTGFEAFQRCQTMAVNAKTPAPVGVFKATIEHLGKRLAAPAREPKAGY